MAPSPLGALRRHDFRTRYLTHDEIGEQLRIWASAYPATMKLDAVARSVEGRDVWLVTVGRDPERVRPAVWIDANIHASELCGSSVALTIVEELLSILTDDPSDRPAGSPELPETIRAFLAEDALFYVMPRMCPDGAERVLERRHFVRSNPRDTRLGRTHAYWRNADVDGDGKALLMRVRDDAGDFVDSPDVPGLLLPRRLEDKGPFYRVYPEGVIENFDGQRVPQPSIFSDSETDVNRNFPSMWEAEPIQPGAGPYPASEPESRAVTELAVRHPNIFAWLSLHTYGGVFIRPLGDKPDSKMNPHDQGVFRLVERFGDDLVGYPTVSGFHEFTYEPDKPLHGDLANFAYVERGTIGFVCELWDFFKQVGFEVKRPFIKNYQERVTREDTLAMARWDREHNQGRIVGTWRPFDHPQLGPIEIGGYDPLVGVWNPPPDALPDVCRRLAAFTFHLAALAPKVRARLSVIEIEGETRRVVLDVENVGYLPTFVLGSSKDKPWNDPLHAEIATDSTLELVGASARQSVGHLAGWGTNERSTTPMLARSVGEWPRARVEWVVRGKGRARITVAASRVGRTELAVDVG